MIYSHEEIRPQLGKADAEIGELIYLAESCEEDNYEVYEELIQALYDAQAKITEIQEELGYI
jgi:hypothetical protein